MTIERGNYLVIVILDTSVITLLILESNSSDEAYKCKQWLYGLLARGATIFIPDICIYEVLRGILFIARRNNLAISNKKRNLEHLFTYIGRLPLTLEVLERASSLWANAMLTNLVRAKGVDVDLLIIAHLEEIKQSCPGRGVIIATKNIKDFNLLNAGDGDYWHNIYL